MAVLPLAGCSDPDHKLDDSAASPALWLVENGEGQTEGWLFGTIHALPDGVEWRTDALEGAIKQSQWLVVEISEIKDGQQLSRIFGELSTTPGLPPLLDRVDQAHKSDLSALLKKANYKSSDFTATESWAAALTLAQSFSAGDSSNGVDRALLSQFDNIFVLEGAQKQLSIFDTLPEKEQRDLLQAVVAEGASRKDGDEVELAQAWVSGDMELLARENSEGMLADPELRAALLTNRNNEWVNTISQELPQRGPMLIAVGAAHMAGNEGLPALLASKGYKVRRVQ